ncbi:hypothetical protein BT93_L2825 [Corymbia citriodora subsp. variegata]|uniref:Uncharacterized protein n=1 Tax=Corymbia citriodora subsp. variegata TaxID=360336 RepID=A0A8T0CJ31_CORYI|nr:hypothetical protein BT93_L2825 [Corymbia citriodora subsp. variegata]
MKFTLKLPDDDRRRPCHQGGDPTSNHHHHHRHPILKAKVPLTILNHPFTSTIAAAATATHSTTTPPSYFAFSLSTSFPSFPSLKLCYSPAGASSAGSPFSLTLKSGIGLFGSPNDSPLVFSAHFPLSLSSPIPNSPVFSLHFRPQLGHFSLCKSTSSNPSFGRDLDVDRFVEPHQGKKEVSLAGVSGCLDSELGIGGGFSMGGSSNWEELKLEPCSGKELFRSSDSVDYGRDLINGGKDMPLSHRIDGKSGNLKIFSGIGVRARTMLPIMKRARVHIRWGVNLPAADSGTGMPFLTVSKIGFETIEEVKGANERKEGSNFGDPELLKGMFLWMRKDLEEMQRENSEMKLSLEAMRLGMGTREGPGEKIGIGNRDSMNSGARRGGFEIWKSKKSGREETGREPNQSLNQLSSLESELQRAIKSASSS